MQNSVRPVLEQNIQRFGSKEKLSKDVQSAQGFAFVVSVLENET